MTTVFIWENNIVTYSIAKLFGISLATHPIQGHISLNIDDQFVPVVDKNKDPMNFTDNKKSFASWAPSYVKMHHKLETSHNGKVMGVGNRNFFADLFVEQYVPDHIIRLPTPPVPILEQMHAEWTSYLQPKEGGGQSYDLKWKNCARVSSRILRAGWGERPYLKYNQLVSGFWTPNMVMKMALELVGYDGKPARTMEWVEFLSELYEKNVILSRAFKILLCLQKRSDERGSTGAPSRFEVQMRRRSFAGTERTVRKGTENIIPEAIIYTELVERGIAHDQARSVLVDWLKRRPEHRVENTPFAELERIADELIRFANEGREVTAPMLVRRKSYIREFGRQSSLPVERQSSVSLERQASQQSTSGEASGGGATGGQD